MSTPSTTSSAPSFHIRLATENDIEPVLDFLRKNFFRDEPLNAYIKLIETENDTCIELEKCSIKYINSLSVLAVTAAGKIIGASLNGILERSKKEKEEKIENPKYAKIVKLLDTVDRQGDVFGKFPQVQKVMTIKFLSVDGAARGLGIAKNLMDKTREIAREQGCDLMRVDCSSNFSARAVAKLGFECIYALKYEDYLEDGEPVFMPEEPHKQCTIYIQRLF